MMGANFLGIDGGGSSTRVQVVNDNGEILHKAQGGPSNVLVVGKERAERALAGILPENLRIDGVVAGIAGADRPWVEDFWSEALASLARSVWVMGDYRIALAALTSGEPGAIAIFGTGSVFYAEGRTERQRLGGYGWKVGDVGSGIALGHAAILASLKALEACGPTTMLVDEVLRWAKCADKPTLLNYLYDTDTDWRRVSDLAQVVFALRWVDDAAASIIEEASQSIMQYLRVLTTGTGLATSDPVGIAGGLAPLWLEVLNPPWKDSGGRDLIVVEKEPVHGAVLLAQRLWQTQQGS